MIRIRVFIHYYLWSHYYVWYNVMWLRLAIISKTHLERPPTHPPTFWRIYNNDNNKFHTALMPLFVRHNGWNYACILSLVDFAIFEMFRLLLLSVVYTWYVHLTSQTPAGSLLRICCCCRCVIDNGIWSKIAIQHCCGRSFLLLLSLQKWISCVSLPRHQVSGEVVPGKGIAMHFCHIFPWVYTWLTSSIFFVLFSFS